MRQCIAVIVAVCLLISSCSVQPIKTEVSTKPIIVLDAKFIIHNDPVVLFRQEHILLPQDVNCLAKGIYYEAGSESVRGKEAVGFVILNRTTNKKYPSSICKVIKQQTMKDGKKFCQFSWYCSGGDKKLNAQISNENYAESLRIAESILNKKIDNWIPQAVSFHLSGVNAGWTKRGLQEVAHIGRHVFYRET